MGKKENTAVGGLPLAFALTYENIGGFVLAR